MNRSRTNSLSPGQREVAPGRFRRPARWGGLLLLAVLLLGIAGLYWRDRLIALWYPVTQMIAPKRSVQDVLEALGPAAWDRLQPSLEAAGFAEAPPERLRFVAFKEEKELEVWGAGPDGLWRPIRRYPILAASGGPGPKLAEGDRQVPEGLYPITLLNPNSAYHLSLRIGYPSPEDLAIARHEGRQNLGGDIMLHGKELSIGCLAMGDPAIEELFVLTARVGVVHSDILIAPFDLRARAAGDPRPWMEARYDDMRRLLQALPPVRWPRDDEEEGE